MANTIWKWLTEARGNAVWDFISKIIWPLLVSIVLAFLAWFKSASWTSAVGVMAAIFVIAMVVQSLIGKRRHIPSRAELQHQLATEKLSFAEEKRILISKHKEEVRNLTNQINALLRNPEQIIVPPAIRESLNQSQIRQETQEEIRLAQAMKRIRERREELEQFAEQFGQKCYEETNPHGDPQSDSAIDAAYITVLNIFGSTEAELFRTAAGLETVKEETEYFRFRQIVAKLKGYELRLSELIKRLRN